METQQVSFIHCWKLESKQGRGLSSELSYKFKMSSHTDIPSASFEEHNLLDLFAHLRAAS